MLTCSGACMPAIIEFPTVVQDLVAQYGDLFANEPERRHFAEYLTGLFIAERKTVSNLDSPTLRGNYAVAPGNNAFNLQVVGDRTYIADGAGGVLLLDVKNPSSPTLLDTYKPPGFNIVYAIHVIVDLAYVTDGASSLSERTNKVGQERDYQARFVHYRGAGRLWRPPTHPRWVRKRYFNHLSDKLLGGCKSLTSAILLVPHYAAPML